MGKKEERDIIQEVEQEKFNGLMDALFGITSSHSHSTSTPENKEK
jgi:hypothetical protein